jgi:Zn-dependent protease
VDVASSQGESPRSDWPEQHANISGDNSNTSGGGAPEGVVQDRDDEVLSGGDPADDNPAGGASQGDSVSQGGGVSPDGGGSLTSGVSPDGGSRPPGGSGPNGSSDGGGGNSGGRPRGGGIVIGRPFGIPVHISPYWIVIAAVYVFLYANNFRGILGNGTGEYLLAAVAVILLYLSVLVHELSHSLVARGYGLPVRRILLYPLGGVSEIEKEPETPLREFCVSGAGPALSLVLAAIGWGLMQVAQFGWVGALVWQFTWMNLIVGVFNLVPGLPLDGGRMLRAVIWKLTNKPGTATIVAAWTGRGLAIALLGSALYFGRYLPGDTTFTMIWAAVIAAFMWVGAGQSIRATKFRERIPALQGRRLARKAISVDASTPLSEAIRRADEVRARAVVVIDHDSKPIAIVNEAAVMATPPQRRPWVDVGTLARSIQPELILPADISGMGLLDAIKRAPASEYLLVEPSGQVYGVLAARDLDHVFSGV